MNRNTVRLVLAIAFSILLLLGVAPLVAQVDQGSIDGTVQDSSGAVVPNAQVTLLNKDNGLSLQSTTGNSGEYTFSPVRIGHYSVSVTAPGFATTTQENLEVAVDQHVKANIQLKAGAQSETVEVTAAPPLLQTEEGSVGQVVDRQTINDLPLNGRNFTFLAQLAAGVNTPQADTRGNAASGAFSANGLRPAQNNYMLDGIDNNSDTVDFLNGTNFVVLPPVDAIQEFKVQTSDYSAELGRSAGAVLNATVKSGTNAIHGAAWEFFRNDKLDAADYFEDQGGIPKGELRQNQFGVAIGGPVIKNKVFLFGDYEGFRRVQGTITTSSVPTLLQRNSGYSNLTELITAQSGTNTDDLGRSIAKGVVLDPATTRPVTAGSVDPVTGRVATTTGAVRDPFGFASCASATTINLATCPGLNIIPAGRLDANAIKLLNLYPNPTTGSTFSNFASSPNLFEHRNSFDTRLDVNPSEKNQIFARFSYVDDPQFIPGAFGGLADGGAFQQGIQTALAQQSAVAWTHVFTPTLVNVARIGLNYLHTTRTGPLGANSSNLPAQYGIQGIPQGQLNGGLPTITIGGLATIGSNSFLPSNEVSQTVQLTDDLTKIYGNHSFKMGFEGQRINFNTLQPGWSRGQFQFDGHFTDVIGAGGDNTGIAQLLVTPEPSTVGAPSTYNYEGGPDGAYASNIAHTDDRKNYFAGYFQDDWKATPKLTLNLGLRYDFFGLIYEAYGRQANFVPYGAPSNTPLFLIPGGYPAGNLNPAFVTQLAADGIGLDITDKYGKGLGRPQHHNFAPRVGFAYQISPKFVARGGYGIFYNAFENQGYGPNDGENYPFVYNLSWFTANDYTPLGVTAANGGNATPYPGCSTASPGGTALYETGLSCVNFNPAVVPASGLGLQGLSFDFQTPYTLSANFTLQYSITPTLSVQAGYVNTEGRHLQAGIGANNVNAILPQGTSTSTHVPFPNFGGGSYQATIGSSSYNGLQTKIEKQFSGGLNLLATYTWAKAFSDAGDLLNGGSVLPNGYRAPGVAGFGPGKDRGLSDFDVRNVVHLSGDYVLPFGKGKRYMGDAGKISNGLIGGWSVNWIATLQGGQPITLPCPTGTTSGTNCYDLNVPGQSQDLGIHTVTDASGQKHVAWFGNPAAFTQPCVLGASGPIPNSPAGCVPLTGFGVLGGGPSTTTGPGFHRLDFSAFKDFTVTERFTMQFRAEFFNILNHPNFNAPNFGGNGVVAIGGSGNYTQSTFGQIGSTRDAPYDPRQIQFALKLYF